MAPAGAISVSSPAAIVDRMAGHIEDAPGVASDLETIIAAW